MPPKKKLICLLPSAKRRKVSTNDDDDFDDEENDDNSSDEAPDCRRTRPYKRFSYTEEDLEVAVEKVKKGTLSLNKASRLYGIPKGTLHNKKSGKVPMGRKMGPQTILTKEEETTLAKYCVDMAKLGFPLHGEDVKDSIQAVLKKCPRSNPFKNDRPGDKWLRNFLKRHPNVDKMNTEAISKARALVTKGSIMTWFNQLRQYFANNDCLDIFDDPTRIFNCDETGCQTCPDTGKVLGPKGYKNLYEIKQGSEKESITVLCTYCADGTALPPMVVYPYKRVPNAILQNLPLDWGWGRSDSGWMISETFLAYITKMFKPWLESRGIPLPVVLFLDGHKSHLNMALAEYCAQNGIFIYCLPPNATHIIQPCDVGIFRPLKVKWREEVRKCKRQRIPINKLNFAGIFNNAFLSVSPEVIKTAFKTCGLYPLNENEIDYSKCISEREAEIAVEAERIERTEPMEPMEPGIEDYKATKRVIEHHMSKEDVERFRELLMEGKCETGPKELIFNLWKTASLNTGAAATSRPIDSSFGLPSEFLPGDRMYADMCDDDLFAGLDSLQDELNDMDTIILPADQSVDETSVHVVDITNCDEKKTEKNANEIPSSLNKTNCNIDNALEVPIRLNNQVDGDKIMIGGCDDEEGNGDVIDGCDNEEGNDKVEEHKNRNGVEDLNAADEAPSQLLVKSDACPAPVLPSITLAGAWAEILQLPPKQGNASSDQRKRKTPSVPYCITSTEWRENEAKKLKAKEDKEEEKKESAKLREEKRKEKERIAEEKKQKLNAKSCKKTKNVSSNN